ncbi:MAG: hypothetical protein FJY56_20100, partial [Betaproteobacteria bacterium]|nr:hypothetical protein [Betaproteobacteria bacterium]
MEGGRRHPRYYNDNKPAAIARRGVIAFVLGLCLAYALSSWVQLLEWFFPNGVKSALNIVATLHERLEAVGVLPWNQYVIAVFAVPIAGFIYQKSPLARRLDFLLFAPFDRKTLGPIGAATGILQWHVPASGGLHDAWTNLRQWVTHGAVEERWKLEWLMSEPDLGKPFDWTLLVGAGGIGKTQLAKELGRQLALRDVLGDKVPTAKGLARAKRHFNALAAWWRRVVPYCAVAAADPWDAALIGKRGEPHATSTENQLKEWTPRRPTLLILDDPLIGVSRKIIEALEGHKSEFWYPVRLIIVNTVVPSDLLVEPDPRGTGWSVSGANELAFKPVILPEQHFDVATVEAILARGYWAVEKETPILRSGADLRAIHAKHLPTLVNAVEGSPLLIALAVSWLGAGDRSLLQLLGTANLGDVERDLFSDRKGLKELVQHRLMKERVTEYYRRYEAIDGDASAALRVSVACATIADGVSRRYASEKLQLELAESKLRRAFPFVEAGAIDPIPPLRPWLLGEHLVRVLKEDLWSVNPEALDQLIQNAFEANPRGALKALSRKGWLAGEVARVLEALPAPADADDKLALFEACAEHSLFVDRKTLPQALRRAGE